jgi:adenylate cyclase
MADGTGPESDDLQRRLERILLGGERKYTRLQVTAKAGVPEGRARRLWRALGFATVGDDDVVFTDADVEAIRIADQLFTAGLVMDEGEELAVTRALGLHLSRLAEWQVHMLWKLVTRDEETVDAGQMAKLVEQVLPELGKVQDFVWRRHLAAFAGRGLTGSEEDLTARSSVAGFVDMVGYTRLTRQIDESRLSGVLDAFEALSTETVAEHHGQVVKMIGDEVLFVTGSAVEAAEIALTLIERADADERLPPLRAGMAFGRILSRYGDVYGSVVNVAARLTSVARASTILVDRELARELAGEPAYEVRHRRPVPVRGYSRLRAAALRRSDERPTGMFAVTQQLAGGMPVLNGSGRSNGAEGRETAGEGWDDESRDTADVEDAAPPAGLPRPRPRKRRSRR